MQITSCCRSKEVICRASNDVRETTLRLFKDFLLTNGDSFFDLQSYFTPNKFRDLKLRFQL